MLNLKKKIALRHRCSIHVRVEKKQAYWKEFWPLARGILLDLPRWAELPPTVGLDIAPPSLSGKPGKKARGWQRWRVRNMLLLLGMNCHLFWGMLKKKLCQQSGNSEYCDMLVFSKSRLYARTTATTRTGAAPFKTVMLTQETKKKLRHFYNRIEKSNRFLPPSNFLMITKASSGNADPHTPPPHPPSPPSPSVAPAQSNHADVEAPDPPALLLTVGVFLNNISNNSSSSSSSSTSSSTFHLQIRLPRLGCRVGWDNCTWGEGCLVGQKEREHLAATLLT